MSGPEQPRQPRDLQGLLKFCMEATSKEDAPESGQHQPMDPERQRWLEEALSRMSVDVVKELAAAIEVFSKGSVLDPNATDDEIDEVVEAFERVGDWVDNIDMANNFHKLGGFKVLERCLRSPTPSIRAASANALAELTQNNPYCQEHVLDFDADSTVLRHLLNMLENDADERCQLKALYAVSCLVRDYKPALERFLELRGPEALLKGPLQRSGGNSRLVVKASFLISVLSELEDSAKKAFLDIGIHRQLVVVLQELEHEQAHEQVTKALLTLLRGSPIALEECRTSKELGFEGFLEARQRLLQGEEEFLEELQHVTSILELCHQGRSQGGQKASSVDR